jgi:hypothetical protein
MQETSVIQLDGESKVALVFGQMNEPPGARARVALTGKLLLNHLKVSRTTFGILLVVGLPSVSTQSFSSIYYFLHMLTVLLQV